MSRILYCFIIHTQLVASYHVATQLVGSSLFRLFRMVASYMYNHSWGHYSKNVTCYILLITSTSCNMLQSQKSNKLHITCYFEGCNYYILHLLSTSNLLNTSYIPAYNYNVTWARHVFVWCTSDILFVVSWPQGHSPRTINTCPYL